MADWALNRTREVSKCRDDGESVAISVVIPVFNEAENLRPLLEELEGNLSEIGDPFEVIVVDDGSTDVTFSHVKEQARQKSWLKGVRLSRNCGQTAAIQAGFDASRGKIVVTMDGDFQNDPGDIERLLQVLDEGFDVACGWRKQRQEGAIARVIPSRIANKLIAWLTGSTLHDHGCTLKAFRRRILLNASLYSDMHRFLVPILGLSGLRYKEVVVNHRARGFGRSHYGLAHVQAVFLDLLTLALLTRFTRSPLRFFGLCSVPLFLFACFCLTGWGFLFVTSTVQSPIPVILPTASMLFAFAFANLIMVGLAAELTIWTSQWEEREQFVEALPLNLANSNGAHDPIAR